MVKANPPPLAGRLSASAVQDQISCQVVDPAFFAASASVHLILCPASGSRPPGECKLNGWRFTVNTLPSPA